MIHVHKRFGCGLRLVGLGFGFLRKGLMAWDLGVLSGLRDCGLGFKVCGLGCRGRGLALRVSGFNFPGSD